jgi:mannose/cellobiose epimerase-like protein (N-acyl-D-glucosamine 2-epimerase family)
MTLHSGYRMLTVHGQVTELDPKPGVAAAWFDVKTRAGDVFRTWVGPETGYQVITNLDNLDRDRVPDLPGEDRAKNPVLYDFRKYLAAGRDVTVTGVHQENDGQTRFEARAVRLMHAERGRYVFEETHWWLAQTRQMADRILDHLFDARRSYTIDDFSKFYRTQLGINGQRVDDTMQECAVLSRLTYDLSTAYLMTGNDRYFAAARAAVAYLREAFRSPTHDNRYLFWAYGRRRNVEGERAETLIFASQGPDDVGTIPLYEQIYALAGLVQFYRITQDWEVLEDIRLTLNTFQDFFHDPPSAKAKGFAGTGGYYSHLDPVTMRPDSPHLGPNGRQKNWNSNGDHIPGYLVNLILALDPLPHGNARETLEPILALAVSILEETSAVIVERFPDPELDFVCERFTDQWKQVLDYRWQKNRAVVGHDLKIAWNLTRVAYYHQMRAWRARATNPVLATASGERAKRCLSLAHRLADRMGEVGLDQLRGGVFDCVERKPQNGMPTEFAWMPTKDFWQQEQGILAYLILQGATEPGPDRKRYAALARECSAFWNTFFLDRERQGYFFRVTEDGLPILEGEYGRKSGHAIGYHAFELAYLAHTYTRVFCDVGGDPTFSLHFRVKAGKALTSVNVLPDFLPPDSVTIARIIANGVDVTDERKPENLNDFQISIADLEPDGDEAEVKLAVEFRSLVASAV